MATKTTTTTKPRKKKVTEAAIRKKAQQIYQERLKSFRPGDAESDWLEAEKELMSS